MVKRKTEKRKPKQTTMNISIPASLRTEIQTQMRESGFENASEYFRQLVRAERARRVPAWLEEKIEEGLKGPFEVADEAWLAARRAKLEQAIKSNERKRRKIA